MTEQKKTSMGMEENVASMLAYLVGWITGLIFFLVEKENKTVRFHAMQSILLSCVIIALNIALGITSFIPYAGYIVGPVSGLVSLGAFILWIILMVKTYQGEKIVLPVIGEIAEKQANK